MMLKQQQQPYIVPPCAKDVNILYADEDILLINKPEGLLSVPGRHPLNRECVVSRLQKQGYEVLMPHRLDLDTSGLMVVALHKQALASINRQFEQRSVEKSYTAIVFGIVQADLGEIDLPLIADWPNRPLQKVCHESGKGSHTRYEVLERIPDMGRTRLKLVPLTGRSHQLRVHLSAIGHPVLGCDLYAHEAAFNMSPRLLLHSTTLDFTHPRTGDRVFMKCEPEF